MSATAPDTDMTQPLAERLARNADGILEEIARTYGVTTLDEGLR